MKNTALTILAILAFGGTGFFLYRSFSPAEQAIPDYFEAPGVCVACKQEVMARHRYDESEPLVCPACEQRAVFKWRFCNECHRRFIPKLTTDPDTGNAMIPMGFTCIACSCADVTYFVPDLPGQLAVGDAELPKWPPSGNGK